MSFNIDVISEYSKHLMGLHDNDTLHVFYSATLPLKEHSVSLCGLFCDAIIYWIISVCLLILLGFIYRCIPHTLREHLWRWVDSWGLKLLFILSWSLGFIVYCVGGYDDGFGILSVAFMSLIHATEMFVGGSDISAVHEAQHGNAFYMFMFGLSHFLAIFCSLLFVIRQIGFFVISKFSAWLTSIFGSKRQNTFVFWGINSASLIMAENILAKSKKYPKEVGTFRLIFVRTQDDSNRDSEGFNPSNIFDKVKMRRHEYKRLRAMNCMVVSGAQRLSMLNVINRNDVLQKELGLYSLCRIINWKSDATHIFMIGNDSDANLTAALNLTFDETIKKGNNKVHIYCHSMKSAKTRLLEYYGLTHHEENTEVHIIDTSHLSVSQLKMDVKCHPVQHVSINKDATIDTPFNSMIVGFGETGLETLRFLYEFGAFVGSDKKKSPFHCSVFDNQMEERKGLFEAQTPFLEICNEIHFYNHAINTPEYWGIIKQNLIEDLNYIVVCPGNDQLALEATSNLCAMAIKHRTEASPRKLTICIRSYDAENAVRLQNFCDDINEKYKVYGIELKPFGKIDELFTYDLIVDDCLLKQAKQYNYNYSKDPDKNNKNIDQVWKEELGCKDSNAYCIDEIEEIERKREQNFCNAVHGKTKLYILDECCNRRDIPADIRENMARLEHERWVACMHINGWQRLCEPIVMKDGSIKTRKTTQKLHTDLCPWEEIRKWDKQDQQTTQWHDYKVLDTTLELALEENKTSKS